ncbi:MAG: Acyl-phosphate glycerol-3-phosphate O-acyltransferase PlsY [Actinomycetia bacterium]|nr:Acyl-phosphate glycerol-3-phosphate O-acyltransferase PlsY [Actinomycetes bacterium]
MAVLLVVGAYLLGTLPTAAVVSRRTGHDPTTEGSGNPGATNVYRTAGRRAGALVLAGDVIKGALAGGVGWLAGDHLLGLVCGAAAVAGHVLPAPRRFRGGKGVATSAGVTLVLFPAVGVGAAVVWAVVARLTRRASVASLVLAIGVPLAAAATGATAVESLLLAVVGLVVLVRHAENIERLVRGTERPVEAGAP